jgi:very-short-patch-repair endonuclease
VDDLLRSLTELACRQHGVVSVPQLTALGATRHVIGHLIASGQWERLSPLVLRRTGSPATRRQQLMIAVLDAGAEAGLSHLVAARLWGVNCRAGWPDVMRQRGATTIPSRFARIHEPRLFPDHHRTVLDGIPVCVPSRIPFDVAAALPTQAPKVLDRLWGLGLLSHRSTHQMLDELAERGRKGIRLMRELLAERGPDYRPNDTNVEDRFQELAKEAGLHQLVRQHDLCGREWLGRVDFVWLEAKLVIEVQSAKYHEALIDRVADAARRAQLDAEGWRVEELWDRDIWFDPAGTVQRLRRIRARVS